MVDVLGKNGKLNGLFAVQALLGEDIFFFNEGEIGFDGEHHILKGIQLNAEKVHSIPNLMEAAQQLAMGLVDCMMYVEQNEKLMCPLSRIDEDLRAYINNEKLTGITLMHLFAWHLLKLVEGDMQGNALETVVGVNLDKADFTIIGDVRVLNGIPNSHEMIDELIHSLLRYNDDDRNIKVQYLGMNNYDV